MAQPKKIDNGKVGYGKPPKATRFKKGQSGNPRGRPKKKKAVPPHEDTSMDKLLEAEAWRTLRLSENGKTVELPAAQALVRSRFASALKGNRLSQRNLHEILTERDKKAEAKKTDVYLFYRNLKRKGEAAIAEARKREEKPPVLYPHPNDILLDPVQGKAYVLGPESPEEALPVRRLALWQDWLLANYARSQKGEQSERTAEDRYECGGWIYLFDITNKALPPSMQYSETDQIAFVTDWSGLSQRQFTKRLAALMQEIKALPPDPQTVLEERRKQSGSLAALGDSLMVAASELMNEQNDSKPRRPRYGRKLGRAQ